MAYLFFGFFYSKYLTRKQEEERLQTKIKTQEAQEKGMCYSNGNYYKVGESFPSSDSCNTCICKSYNGGIGAACTLIGCPIKFDRTDIILLPYHALEETLNSFISR